MDEPSCLPPCAACRKPFTRLQIASGRAVFTTIGAVHETRCAPMVERAMADLSKQIDQAA